MRFGGKADQEADQRGGKKQVPHTVLRKRERVRDDSVLRRRLVPVDLGGAAILPRSLRCVARRTQTVRRKKPGRSGRDDRKREFVFSRLPSAYALG
jgi:hypothetical protein